MSIKRFIPVIAIAGLVAATACERREETRIETPAVEQPTPAPTVEPAPPLTTDTVIMDDTLITDTLPINTP